MTRARYLADFKQDDGTGYATKYATGFSPQFSGTPTGIVTDSIADGTITAVKVAADVATQAEIDLKANLDSPNFTGDVDFANAILLTPVYSGAATGFPLGAAANVYHEISTKDWNDGSVGEHFFVTVYWTNHNAGYGYNCAASAYISTKGPNTSSSYRANVHWHRFTLGTSSSYNGLPVQFRTHTATTSLTVNMYISYASTGAAYPPLRLFIRTNVATSGGAPSMKIFRMYN